MKRSLLLVSTDYLTMEPVYRTITMLLIIYSSYFLIIRTMVDPKNISIQRLGSPTGGPTEHDPLSEQLQNLQLASVFYTRSCLSAPWGMAMPAIHDSMMFHLLVSGRCVLEAGGDRIAMQSGDFVLLPQGRGHQLGDTEVGPFTPLAELPLRKISEHFEELDLGGGGEKTIMLCGAIRFSGGFARRVVAMMPDIVQIKAGQAEYMDTLGGSLRLLAAEAGSQRIGTHSIVTRLADIVLIQAIRAWIEQQQTEETGWLAAIREARIGKAMRAVHKHPEQAWTLETLAAEAGMSRTAFAEKFRKMVGDTPLQYLTRWRMQLASDMLAQSDAPLIAIAENLAYQSEAAFSRAFKRHYGCAPGQARKQARMTQSKI